MRWMVQLMARVRRQVWHRLDGLSQPMLSTDEQRGFTVKHSGGS